MQYDTCAETVAVQQWISSAINEYKGPYGLPSQN